MHIELAFEPVLVVPANKLATTLWVQNVIIGGTKRARTSSCGLVSMLSNSSQSTCVGMD
jgi:hypothetical protein